MSIRRSYRSELREEHARATRLRIRSIARELIEERGFGTTIADIARAANVAPQTVYAIFGSKAGIVGAILEELQEAAGQDAFVAEVFAEPDPRRQVRLFVSWLGRFVRQGAPIIRAALGAGADPDVHALSKQGDATRLAGCHQLAGLWAAAGALAPGLAVDDAAERLWLLTSVELFLHASDDLGWTADRFEEWLANTIERELFEPTGARPVG